MLFRLIALLIGYCFGNISPGIIIAKINGVDIKSVGSKNVGATNVSRTVGIKMGILTLILDCIKAIIPAIIVYFIFSKTQNFDVRYLCAYSAFGAVMGHIFPITQGFKGGKGIAASLGFLLVAAPITALGCLLAFSITVITTRYVSLGSLICAIVLPIEALLLYYFNVLPYPREVILEVVVLFVLDAVICAFKHKDNMIRLVQGNENKFTFKRSDKFVPTPKS